METIKLKYRNESNSKSRIISKRDNKRKVKFIGENEGHSTSTPGSDSPSSNSPVQVSFQENTQHQHKKFWIVEYFYNSALQSNFDNYSLKTFTAMFNYIDDIPESVQDYCDSWFDDSSDEDNNDGRTINSAD